MTVHPPRVLLPVAALICLAWNQGIARADQLPIEERVRAREALERLYHSYRAGVILTEMVAAEAA